MALKQSTLDFLSALALNNNRDWFQENKSLYIQAKADFLEFSEEIILAVQKMDNSVPKDLNVLKSIFRIYRDVRFSKDKSPYKVYFGLWIPTHSKAEEGPGYYIHLQPGNSFIGAGYWKPNSAHLKSIREEIDYNGPQFNALVGEPDFLKHATFNWSDALKNAPKGYSTDHPDIEYLKLKSFEVHTSITDEELKSNQVSFFIINKFNVFLPLVTFIRNAISY